MKISFTLFVVMLLTAVSVYALPYQSPFLAEGGRVGNGGGFVVCRNPATKKIKSVELLDFYEARTIRGITLDLKSLKGDWKTQAQQLIDRLSTLSPLRQTIYSEWLKRFDGEATFLKNEAFSTIPDTGFVAVPKGCAFEQGLVQNAPLFSKYPRYLVNDELWQAMGESQKAGLMLHEFLYREAFSYGHTDSISVRYLSGTITDVNFAKMDVNAWIKLLMQARYEMTDVSVPELKLTTVFNIDKMWAAGPDETTIMPSIKDRIPFKLGTCNGDGCSKFIVDDPNRGNLDAGMDYSPQIQFPEGGSAMGWTFNAFFIQRIDFENFSLDFSSDIMRSNASRSFTPQFALMRSYPDSRVKFTYTIPYGPTGQGVDVGGNGYNVPAFDIFMKDHSITATASAVTLKEEKIAEITAFSFSDTSQTHVQSEGVYLIDRCQSIVVSFDDSQSISQMAKSYDNPACCNPYPSLAPIYAHFSGGSMRISSHDTTDVVLFNPTLGHYISGGTIGDLVFSDTSALSDAYGIYDGFNYECTGTDLENKSGCFIKTNDLMSDVITTLTLQKPVLFKRFPGKQEPINQGAFTILLAPQNIDLYPNGYFKSAIIAADVADLLKRDGTKVSFKSGEQINFDADGYVIQ